jgi:hypothetical protein
MNNVAIGGTTALSGRFTDVTLTTGNLIVANDKGIDFSATPGTGTSELLADYEEGDWTGALTPASGSISLSFNSCKYTKVGRQVTVSGFLYVSGTSSPSGALQITGLPFAAPSGFPFYSAASIYATNLGASATTSLAGYIPGPSSAITIGDFTSGNFGDIGADVGTNSVFVFTLTYITS